MSDKIKKAYEALVCYHKKIEQKLKNAVKKSGTLTLRRLKKDTAETIVTDVSQKKFAADKANLMRSNGSPRVASDKTRRD